MAKVVNGGNKRGKLGNSIYYTIKNSNNKVTQGERIYQPNVTNPQSETQRAQRMKMKPATNFYAALGTILDHSFQGVKYGAMSRQYFLQQAIGKTQEVFPYLLKGENKFVPGPYLVSKGSLTSIGYTLGTDFRVNISGGEDDDFSVSNISKGLLKYNASLQNGDQITFILIYEATVNNNTNYVPFIGRFILDSESDQSLIDVMPNIVCEEVVSGSHATFQADLPAEGMHTLAAGCVIVSRKNTSGGEVWQRSTERMLISDRVYEMYMSPSAYADALESYKRSAASFDSEYYLNDAETPEEVSGGTTYAFINELTQFTLGTANQDALAVVAKSETGGVATCAEFGFYSEERPGGETAWILPYVIRGRELIAGDRVELTGPTEGQLTAKSDGVTIQVYTPQQFAARFADVTIG